MEALQNRIESFAKSKRVKGSKSSRSAPKWPHPQTFKANPESLAEAGFYFNPSAEDKDNVSCFECGKQLSEWEEHDDPFDLHWTKCGDKCSWAAVRCGLRGDMDRHGKFTFPDKSRLPGSKRMEKARLGTFNVGDGWIHDQTKGHSANSRKMAQAGFAWTPQVPGDDLTTCLYCNISLSGWEEEDDPMEEHRKRAKSCPFLVHSSGSGSSSATQTTAASPTTNKLTRSTSAKPPAKAQTKPPSRSRSSRQTRGHKELARMTENHSLEEEENGVKRISEEIEDEISDIPTVRLVQKPAEPQRTRKSSRAPSARPSTRGTTRAPSQPAADTENMKGKSQGRSRALKNVREEESSDEIAHCISEEEETGQQRAPSRHRASRKPTKARAKSTSRRKQEEVITQDESEDLGASNRKTLKGRKKRVVEETDPEDEDIQPVGRNVSGTEEEEVVVAAPQPRAPKKTVGKSSSRSKKDERSHEAIGSKGRRQAAKHVEKEESGTDVTREEENVTNYGMSEQEEEEEHRAPSRSRSTTKASKRSSKAPSANASRKKKEASGARQREEETLDEDDSNHDHINPSIQDQSEPDEKDLTPAPSRSRALRKSAKPKDTSSRKENNVSSTDELQSPISKHKNQKNRLTSGDDVVGDEDTVHFLRLGNEEERTPVQRPRVPISEKFRPVRSPRKEVQGLDSVKPAVVVETMFKKDDKNNRAIRRISDEDLLTSKVHVEDISPEETTIQTQISPSPVAVETIIEIDNDKSDQVTWRISHEDLAPSKVQADDATLPPTELSALNFENTPIVVERTAAVSVSPSQSSVPIVKTPSLSPAPIPAMTFEATVPEPQIPPALPTMTAKATTPEPQVLSALPTTIANGTTAEPQTFPALSRIPFMPLQTLTDAELDMTVEEWIRYQMEIEYDKLKRDGERELARFKARAEEARRIIESL